MNQATWNSYTEPQEMLEALRASGRASERKRRLFAVACCRRIWPLLTDERSRKAVEVAERQADGDLDLTAASKARGEAHAAAGERNARTGDPAPAAERLRGQMEAAAAQAAAAVLQQSSVFGFATSATSADLAAQAAAKAAWVARKRAAQLQGAPGRPAAKGERAAQAALLRCIFGPLLFRPPPPVAAAVLAWQGGTVGRLAAGLYAERDFTQARTGVLADAAEEAGVTDAELLGHLRGPGPHARGCWIVDLLLGKE
jgi:hypothetical protein